MTMRLMIVDDHAGVRAMIRQLVAAPNDEICECASGDEAVRVAGSFRPDAVAMDVRMPGMCGFDAVRAIRAAHPEARVVMVTSHDEPFLRQAAQEAGAAAFFAKDHRAGLRPALAGGEPTAAPESTPAALAGEDAAQLRNLERFRLLVENSWDLVGEVDLQGRIHYASPNVKETMGYAASDLLGANIFDFIHPDDMELVKLKFALPESRVACRCRHQNGSWRWLETSGRNYFLPDGSQRRVLIARDVTEQHEAQTGRARLEAQLRNAQHLEALGALAGGIAHDFNNILGGILAYTDLARLETPGQPEVQDFLGQVLKAGERAKELVRQILSFTRRQEQERKPLLLQSVVAEALTLCRSTMSKTIEIVADVDEKTGPVLADSTRVHQVLLNLCTNAAHAMGREPGRLTVGLHPVEISAAQARLVPGLTPGMHARISVSDTGHGMTEQTLRRLFEPLFTTKAPGEGTGLGLPVVQRIMQEHEGAIEVISQPGQGATFRVYFPLRQPGPVASERHSATVPPRGRAERILFVDDEPTLCAGTAKMLERLGYVVETSTQPRVALELFRSRPADFDLVITNLHMPCMTGLDLADQLRRARPEVPVLLTTGFSEALTPDQIVRAGIREVVMKPVTRAALAAAVDRALRCEHPAAPQAATN